MKSSNIKIIKIFTLAIGVLCIIGIAVSVVSQKKSSAVSEENTVVVGNEEEKECTEVATTSEVLKEAEEKSTNEVCNTNTETKGQESSVGSTRNIEENKQVKEQVSSNTTLISDPSSQTVTLRGYIIDEDCFVNYPNPALEDRGCLNMPECAASGYGIAAENGESKFYYFDGAISTIKNGERVFNATGGQQIAWDFIDKKIPDRNPAVTVIGVLSSESRTNPDKSTADGIIYSVIKIISIEINK